MGVTREFTPVLIRQSFLLVESNGQDSCATSRDTRDAHSIHRPFRKYRGARVKLGTRCIVVLLVSKFDPYPTMYLIQQSALAYWYLR